MTNPNQDNSSQQAATNAKDRGKKIAGKSAKFLAKKGKNILTRTLSSTLGFLIPYILAIFAIVLLVSFSYFAIFEYRGTEQKYSQDYNNEYKYSEDGYFKTDSISYENKTIKEFYRYFSKQSYKQIIGDDVDNLISPDDEKAVKDYHNREETFNLTSTLLFALDDFLYQNKVKYPEQFIKSVNFDKETLKLKDLTDDNGYITVESEEQKEDGTKTGKKIKSVRDYGLGSILKYEEFERTQHVKGVYDQIEVWDSVAQKVVLEDYNEPFELEMDGYPEDIHLITKAITFVGEFEYVFEYKQEWYEPLKEGIAQKENDPNKLFKYATVCTKWEEVPAGKDADGNTIYETKCVSYQDLYKHRSSDSAVFETMPRVVEDISDIRGDRYLRDYVYNFESYIPKDVLEKFDFSDRVGVLIETDLEVGSSLNNGAYLNSLKYLDIVEELCDKWGIEDPMLIIAMMAQESGGKPNINGDGLMQVQGSSRQGVTPSGESVKVPANGQSKLDPRVNIEMGIIEFKNRLDDYDGDALKAIQSYNFGAGGLNWIKTNYPESWDTLDWLNYREESRAYFGEKTFGGPTRSAHDTDPAKKDLPRYGDTLYLEHVLRYYGGNSFAGLDEHSLKGSNNSFLANIGKSFMKFLRPKEKDVPVPNLSYKHHIQKLEADHIFKMAKAMGSQELFSQANYEDLDFWEEGFPTNIDSENMNYQEFSNLAPNIDGYYSPVNVPNAESLITSPYGYRIHPVLKTKKFHQGIDIGLSEGTQLFAVADGIVRTKKSSSYGNYIVIEHTDGTSSLYAHLTDSRKFGYPDIFVVEDGQRVEAGQFVALVGTTGRSTGPHLHFEFKIKGQTVNPYHIVVGKK